MAIPRYLERVARMPRVLAHIGTFPEGVLASQVAAHFDIPVDELREDLLAYYVADPENGYGLSRPLSLQLDNLDDAQSLRITVTGQHDLGVEVLGAGELARLRAAAASLAQTEPENQPLQRALAVIEEALLGQIAEPTADEAPSVLTLMREAIDQHRAVRLVYSRAWRPGITEREVRPHRLVHSHRGWELDAEVSTGSTTDAGIRTFLLGNIREAALTDDTFTPPPDLEARLAANRRTERVTVTLPAEAQWVLTHQAEHITVLDSDGENVTAELELLPPVERRMGLILLAGGPDTVVPPKYLRSAVAVARELHEHYS